MKREYLKPKTPNPKPKKNLKFKGQIFNFFCLSCWSLKLCACFGFGVLGLGFFLINVYADDIRDVRPPVDFPPNYFWLYALLAVVFIVGLGFLIRTFLKNKGKLKPSAVLKLPHEIALERLEKIKSANLPAQGKIKEYFAEISDIVRQYIERRFDIRAPEMTTEEFLQSLRFSMAPSFLKDFVEDGTALPLTSIIDGKLISGMSRAAPASSERLSDNFEGKQGLSHSGNQEIDGAVLATTELSRKASADFKAEHQQSLSHFLNACDMVKFAQYGPTADEMEKTFSFAIQFIHDTKPVLGIIEEARK